MQPCQGIAWWAHRDDDRQRGNQFLALLSNPIGSKDPDALKIPARRAEYSLTDSASSPVQAEPRQLLSSTATAGRSLCPRKLTRNLSMPSTGFRKNRANKIVILTGAGGEFITDVDWSSFGDVADPGVWSQVHDEGVQALENIANIRVPVIAAIEGRAHVHSDYALLASVIVAGEGATFQDVAHFGAGVAPGDGIFTTWSYRAGAGRAEAFLLNPQPLPARTAREWGVVAEVVPNGKALSRARELAELYLKAPEVTRRNTRIHFIQPLKERIVREVGYGLSLEGASSADLVKSMRAKSESVARKGKVA